MATLTNVALATHYYVDAINGNDSWSGTLPDPNAQNTDGAWRTIAKVNAQPFRPGDFIQFRCGDTWRESLATSNAGVSGFPITYGQYGANCSATNKPVITGADLVTGWSIDGGYIYKATFRKPVQQLFVDGQHISLAHYPNKGYLTIAAKSSTSAPCSTGANYLIAGSDLNTGGNDITGASVHIRNVDWNIEDNTVTGTPYDNQGSRVNLHNCTSYNINQGWGYYLDNQKWMLDSPGEWFWDAQAQTLYVWLPDSGNPSAHVMEASVRDSAIVAQSTSSLPVNVVLDGLSANDSGKNSVYFSCHPSNSCPSPGNFTLSNLSIANSGDSGVRVEGDNSPITCNSPDQPCRSIEYSTISNSVRQGIVLAGVSNVTVTHNTVTNSGTIGMPVKSLAGIAATPTSNFSVKERLSAHLTVTFNSVMNSGYIGISFGHNSTISNNNIEQSCMVLDDCGAIYTWNGTVYPAPAYNSLVQGNVIKDVIGGQDGEPVMASHAQGIYLDNLTNAVTVQGNTIVNADNGIYMNNPYNNTIKDNVIYGGRIAQISINEVASPLLTQGAVQGNTVTNNILFPINNAFSLSLSSIYNLSLCTRSTCSPDYSSLGAYFGTFNLNSYVGLYSNRIVQETYNYASTNLSRPQFVHQHTLQNWQALGRDKNSTLFNPYSILPYTYTPSSVRLIDTFNANDYFSGTASGWTSYSLSATTSVSLTGSTANSCLTSSSGGCMNFKPASKLPTYTAPNGATYLSPSFAIYAPTTRIFSFTKGATYLVQFMASSVQKNQNSYVRLRNPVNNTQLGIDELFVADPAWRKYSYIFTANGTATPANMDFILYNKVIDPGNTSGDQSIRIDNVSVNEVNLNPSDPDNSYILLNSTDGQENKPCPAIDQTHCTGYIDLNGASVSWPILLNPYSSKIVVWANSPQRDTDHDGVADGADLCPQTVNPVEAEASGCAPTDLAITGIGPSTAYYGSPVTYNYTITNNGPDQAGGIQFTDNISGSVTNVVATASQGGSCRYNSSNNTVTCNFGLLAPKSSATVSVSKRPTTIGPVTDTANVSGAATDTNTNNGRVRSTTNVQALQTVRTTSADLAAPTAPTATRSGGQLTINDGVKNQGTAAAGGFDISYYLSTDTTYQAGTDTFICKRSVTSLAAGASNPTTGTMATTCATPAVANGVYYVLAVNDSGNTVVESIETNNVRATGTTISLGADLIAQSVTVSKSGSTLTLKDSVKNQGTAPASGFAISFYLSFDKTYQVWMDYLICSRNVSSLGVSALNPASGTVTSTCTVPAAAPAGTYYVIVVDDATNTVLESIETNNSKSSASTITK